MSIRLAGATLLLALLASNASAEPRLLDQKRLFSVRSSYNKNEVVYEALLDGGHFDLARPIRVYWILHASGDRLENLSMLEDKLAFGVVLEEVLSDSVRFHLKGAPDRPITARIEGALVTASTPLKNEECSLASIYASVDPRGLIPSVNYVELLGHSRASGQLRTERIAH